MNYKFTKSKLNEFLRENSVYTIRLFNIELKLNNSRLIYFTPNVSHLTTEILSSEFEEIKIKL